jgi:hypothetical protein
MREFCDFGVPADEVHDMRHTHATLLLEGGETIKYVAERLGDREDTVVETYAHVTPRMRSSAVSRVRGIFRADLGLGNVGMATPRVLASETLIATPLLPAGPSRRGRTPRPN